MEEEEEEVDVVGLEEEGMTVGVVGGQDKVVEREVGDKTFIEEMGLDQQDEEERGELEVEDMDDSFLDPDYEEPKDLTFGPVMVSSDDSDSELELEEGFMCGRGKKRGLGRGGRKTKEVEDSVLVRGSSLGAGPSGLGQGKAKGKGK